jgi:hypothetical protein
MDKNLIFISKKIVHKRIKIYFLKKFVINIKMKKIKNFFKTLIGKY